MAYAPAGYLTLSETADRLGCDPSSLRHLIRRGFLPAAKPGGVWFVAGDVVDMMAALDRPVGRPTKLGKAWRASSRTLLHEIADRAAAASPDATFRGAANERSLMGRVERSPIRQGVRNGTEVWEHRTVPRAT